MTSSRPPRKSVSTNSLKSLEENLSLVLLPRAKWVPDNQAHCCFNCNKSFIPFVRPKHHCRRCGNVFCNTCSQNFLLGAEIGAEKDKKLRFCDYCFQGYQNFLKLKKNSSKANAQPSETLSQMQSLLIKEKEGVSASIKHRVFFTETTNVPFLQETHLELVNKSIEEILIDLFRKSKVYEKWFRLLFELMEKAAKSVVLSTINRADFMDINRYVKVKKIPFEDQGFSRLLNGVACRKNIIDKKMKNKFLSPRIFIATQIELVGNSDIAVFENLIQNEKKQIKKIIDKIMKLKPNVILLEKSINRIALEYFREANIIIIVKIKHNLLKRIARVTKATIIKELSMIDKLPEDKIIGSCEKLYIKKFFIEGYRKTNAGKGNEDASNDPNYLFIECLNALMGSTILISGPNEEELRVVKECCKLGLKLMRHFFLEKEVVTTEIILINQINYEKFMAQSHSNAFFCDESLPKLTLKREGDFSKYLFNKLEIGELISKQQISYTKVCYAKSSWENSNEICSNEEAVKYFYQQFGDRKKKTEKSSQDFLEICELPFSVQIGYYSEEDLALGQYLILRVNNLNLKCETCKRPKYQHIVYYYFNKVYVKIGCELTGMSQAHQNFNFEDQMIRQSLEVGFKESPVELGKEFLNPHHSCSRDPISPMQKSFSNSSRTVKPQKTTNSVNLLKIDIKTYIECNACRSILTKETQLSQNYLEYSFTRYLLHFFLNNRPWDEKPRLEESKDESSDFNKCPHRFKNRVFDHSGVLIKMNCGSCKFYELEKLEDVVRSKANRQQLDHVQEDLVVLKREDLKMKIKAFCSELVKILEISAVSSLRNSEQSEKKSLPSMIQSLSMSSAGEESKNNGIEFQTFTSAIPGNEDFEDLEDNDEDENEYYHMGLNAIENSLDLMGKSEGLEEARCESAEGIHNIHKVESTDMLAESCSNWEEVKALEIAVNDKSVLMRQNLYKKLKMEFIFSPNYSENIHKSKGSILSFLNVIMGKIKALQDRFIGQLSKGGWKSFLSLEYYRLVIMRKFSEILMILHFLTQKNDKKAGSSDPISMQSSKKVLFQPIDPEFVEVEEKQAFDWDKVQDEFKASGESSETFTKIMDEHSFKPLAYTHEFRDLYNELNKGRVFSDNKDVKRFREFQKFKVIPVNDDEPLTLVAHALNSCQYLNEIYLKSEFQEAEKKLALKPEKDWRKVPDLFGFFQRILEGSEITEKNSTFNLKSYVRVRSKNKQNDSPNLEANSTEFEESMNFKKLKSKFGCEKVKVTMYYPAFFEALRMANGISLSDFIQSLALNNQWKENSGGKSKAKFIKSYDELYLIKQLQKNEFFMIQSYAKDFFGYMWRVLTGEVESVLSKILGLYEVSINNLSYYYIVMENLFYGLKIENLQVYDLKGSETNRFVKKTKSGQTLLDTNFKIERNNEPVAILEPGFGYFEKASENDSLFLSQHNLIDYSLLLIMDEGSGKVRTGIIDYLRIYTWDKQLEHMGKIVINVGAVPTITNPFDYRERFMNALKRYFMEVKLH